MEAACESRRVEPRRAVRWQVSQSAADKEPITTGRHVTLVVVESGSGDANNNNTDDDNKDAAAISTRVMASRLSLGCVVRSCVAQTMCLNL